MKNIAILGSSGSIGKNALWVAEIFPEEFKIFGLSVRSDTDTLNAQIDKYDPEIVCVADSDSASRLNQKKGLEVLTGEDGLEKLASHPDVDIVVNAVVGFAGLRSTLAAAGAGKRIALANKESMVAGGKLVRSAAVENDAEIIPVDSEHSAIFQCLKSGRKEDVRRVILTSSGGPFRNLPADKFSEITVEQALAHPTWTMGKKITIDSATLMNKGLEIIEAVYLFDLKPGQIEVVIHPQSIIHSMVEFIDGSVVAQMSRPDMRLPLEYALFYPERKRFEIADLAFDREFSLEFEPPDENRFPSLALAREAFVLGGTAPAVFNAANEIAVDAFLREKIPFTSIFETVSITLATAEIKGAVDLRSIMEADKMGRNIARDFIARK